MAASKTHAAATSLQQANKLVNNDGLIKKIKALFFDLDNTLIATRAGDSKAIRKLAELLENQYAFNKDESSHATQTFLKAFRRCPDNSQTSLESWRTYLWRDALPQRHKHLAEKIYSKWLQLRYRYLAFSAEHVQMLRAFRETGMQLALITNGPSNAQWEKIKKTNARQYFDCILVSTDLPWEKPNPNIFFAACNFLGVKPIECAMIGDKLETDIKGGRIANLGATFWLPLSASDADDLTDVTHPPDYILRQLVDLYKYFPIHNHAATTTNGAGSGESSTNHRRNGASIITPTTIGSNGAHNSNSVSSSGHSYASVSSNSNGVALTAQQNRRRGSQINSSSTATSTCESDILQRQVNQHHLRHNIYFNNRHQLNYTHTTHLPIQQQQQHKYRRGNSLSAMECMNSEAENSSDSIFN